MSSSIAKAALILGFLLVGSFFEARREARREERARKKNHQRDRLAQKDRELEGLRRTTQELQSKMADIESRSSSADVARLDQELANAQEAARLAQDAMKDAIKTQDGDKAVEAQQILYQATRRAEMLTAVKHRAAQASQARAPTQGADPLVKKNATEWAAANAWYDPNLGEMDSQVTHTLDKALSAEGWDPKTPEYLEELNSRIRKYLPHRSKSAHNSGAGTDASGQVRQTTAGSGRESTRGGGVQFKLSPDRVAALKESGDWEDPKKRADMIRYYYDFDQRNKAA